MYVYDPSDHRQPKAGAFFLCAGSICLVKSFPDMGKILIADADAVVLHLSPDEIAAALEADPDMPVCLPVGNGICEKIQKEADQ